MKTILVPTDFSKSAENALNYAVLIAQKENAKIILLNAYDILITSPVLVSPEIIMEEIRILENNSKKQLQLLSKKIIEVKKIKCETICKHGFTSEVILEISEKIKPDLIIMGTKGASGIKAVIRGSNTARVIENTNCPTIVQFQKRQYLKE
jgi:nucleotide-binding universal stress UspA family protein